MSRLLDDLTGALIILFVVYIILKEELDKRGIHIRISHINWEFVFSRNFLVDSFFLIIYLYGFLHVIYLPLFYAYLLADVGVEKAFTGVGEGLYTSSTGGLLYDISRLARFILSIPTDLISSILLTKHPWNAFFAGGLMVAISMIISEKFERRKGGI